MAVVSENPSLLSVDDGDVRALLARHFELMRSQSPEESCHVMDDSGLRVSGAKILGWRDEGVLQGIVALTVIGPGHGEIKSMHTAQEARGRGVGRLLLTRLIAMAQEDGLDTLSLETGSADSFDAARALYASEGFALCPPFGAYTQDPLSVFMTRQI